MDDNTTRWRAAYDAGFKRAVGLCHLAEQHVLAEGIDAIRKQFLDADMIEDAPARRSLGCYDRMAVDRRRQKAMETILDKLRRDGPLPSAALGAGIDFNWAVGRLVSEQRIVRTRTGWPSQFVYSLKTTL